MEKIELSSVISFIERSVIPIISLPIHEQRAGTIGTGSIFQLNDRYFLISASHIFDDFEKFSDLVGIPTANLNGVVYNFGECNFYRISDKNLREKYDIIIIELSAEFAEKVSVHYNILTERNLSYKVNFENELLVVGYPYNLSHDSANEKKIYADHFRLSTYLRIPIGTEGIEFDPKAHFLLNYKNISNEEPALLGLRGVSGSPIWSYDSATAGIWTPEKNLKIVGLALAVKTNEYIRGVYWKYAAELFKDIDTEIYNLFKGDSNSC
ncbi:hypothetical protein [Leptospira sarikeiensis]|uniref:Serine protease n=1 Tax=Leptospira sarikeiensis TaxID=2484943 RepID=A0A4R9KDC6_9LEPT|nr:hypothetical protein [Leptospira sarikeiensis]TGL65952.1 hypothetical protein EHQ64_00055 [Leptospira sarikeiensis]